MERPNNLSQPRRFPPVPFSSNIEDAPILRSTSALDVSILDEDHHQLNRSQQCEDQNLRHDISGTTSQAKRQPTTSTSSRVERHAYHNQLRIGPRSHRYVPSNFSSHHAQQSTQSTSTLSTTTHPVIDNSATTSVGGSTSVSSGYIRTHRTKTGVEYSVQRAQGSSQQPLNVLSTSESNTIDVDRRGKRVRVDPAKSKYNLKGATYANSNTKTRTFSPSNTHVNTTHSDNTITTNNNNNTINTINNNNTTNNNTNNTNNITNTSAGALNPHHHDVSQRLTRPDVYSSSSLVKQMNQLAVQMQAPVVEDTATTISPDTLTQPPESQRYTGLVKLSDSTQPSFRHPRGPSLKTTTNTEKQAKKSLKSKSAKTKTSNKVRNATDHPTIRITAGCSKVQHTDIFVKTIAESAPPLEQKNPPGRFAYRGHVRLLSWGY